MHDRELVRHDGVAILASFLALLFVGALVVIALSDVVKQRARREALVNRCRLNLDGSALSTPLPTFHLVFEEMMHGPSAQPYHVFVFRPESFFVGESFVKIVLADSNFRLVVSYVEPFPHKGMLTDDISVVRHADGFELTIPVMRNWMDLAPSACVYTLSARAVGPAVPAESRAGIKRSDL